MTKRLLTVLLALAMAAYPLFSIQAAAIPAQPATDPMPPAGGGLSAEQMDNLLAPIALYPDPLLAQMLPASTFVEQVDQAARYLRANKEQTAGIEKQSWDVSVKSIAHYPPVVYKMTEKLDWTTAIGQAYVTQAADVFTSIQRLRAKAKKAGFLASTPQQTVVVEKDVIKIVPAQPRYIYVPTYDPQVVYVQPSAGVSTGAVIATAAIAFTTGLMIGAWLNNDCNWYSHTVFYHGWQGVGWVSHSATVVHWNNSYYVNNRYRTVSYNAAVVNRNVNYNNINHYTNVSRNVNYNNVNINVNRNNVNVNNVNQNNVNVNNRNVNRNVNTSNINNSYRGKTVTPTAQPTQTSANPAMAQARTSGFGGYGNGAQTMAQSSRGRASRASAPAATTRSRPTRARGRMR